jgi:hypothetical protein
MNDNPSNLVYEIELLPGEKLSLPPALIDSVGPGRWIVSVRAADEVHLSSVRRHDAFLSGYAPEDEGLYDDDSAR